MKSALTMLLALFLTTGMAIGREGERIKVADFSSLDPGAVLPDQWQALTVTRVKKHTRYTLVAVDGATVLQAESDASMSSLAKNIDIDPNTTPWLQWRWRTAAINPASGLENKQNDDFPVRLYVFFDYDIGQLPFLERTKIRIARALYGKQLPLAALCYVWAGKETVGTTAWNAYTDRVRMVVASSGAAKTGSWVDVQRNVAEDYRAAFGEPVPRITGIALASDTDDTGMSSTSWYGDIFFASRSEAQP